MKALREQSVDDWEWVDQTSDAMYPLAGPAVRSGGPIPRTLHVLRMVLLLVVVSVSGVIGATSSMRESPVILPVASPGASNILVPSSFRIETRSFVSASLGRRMSFDIYLPPGYDSSPSLRYPVLYMLHGMSGTNVEWENYGIFEKAEALIQSGEIQPFIIVLPQGDYDYWVDHADGGPKWGAYTAKDVVNEIDRRYRTVMDPAHRAVGGLSMGAHGALQLAINYPGVFGVVGAHSPSLREYEYAPEYFGDPAYYAAHEPIQLFRSHIDIARTLIIWMDVGYEDDWRPVVDAFHQQMELDGIAHTFVEYPGTHDQYYWNANTTDYLRFYASVLGGPLTRSP